MNSKPLETWAIGTIIWHALVVYASIYAFQLAGREYDGIEGHIDLVCCNYKPLCVRALLDPSTTPQSRIWLFPFGSLLPTSDRSGPRRKWRGFRFADRSSYFFGVQR